jgi:hypothetical protein
MDWQTVFERSTINCGKAATRGHVDMLQSVGVREAVVKSIVVDVDIRNPRVVNVDVAEIAPSAAIPGDERLTES